MGSQGWSLLWITGDPCCGTQAWSHSATPLQNGRGRGWGPPPLQQGEGKLCWKGQHHSAFPVLCGVLVGLRVSPSGWGVSLAAVTCSASASPLVTVYCMFQGWKPYNLSAFTVAFWIKWLPSTLFQQMLKEVCCYCKWGVRFPPPPGTAEIVNLPTDWLKKNRKYIAYSAVPNAKGLVQLLKAFLSQLPVDGTLMIPSFLLL